MAGVQIDPALSESTRVDAPPPNASQSAGALLPAINLTTREHAARAGVVEPPRQQDGRLVTTQDEYLAYLETFNLKRPLREALVALRVKAPVSASCARLRQLLLGYWYSREAGSRQAESNGNEDNDVGLSLLRNPDTVAAASPHTPPSSLRIRIPAHMSHEIQRRAMENDGDSDGEEDEADLLKEFDVDGAAGNMPDDELDQDDDDEGFDVDDEEDIIHDSSPAFRDFQRRTRVEAVKRAEGNRRAGGLKTQNAMVRYWREFVEQALEKHHVRDDIVDEHSLLLYIKFSAERPKRTRRGIDIPGTFVGASQLKKQFFGALRIRKEQDAQDPKLLSTRPAMSVRVWDAIKNRMDEALKRLRSGLVPNEDAPDIVPNTMLSDIAQQELDAVSVQFLSHRELHSVINGHLAWTCQHATGNRGDDVRELRLAELQPHTILHPNKETLIPAVLCCQDEDKAGRRDMRTTVNPVYSTLIPHLHPTKCPLGALSFYLHYTHDVQDLSGTLNIDWSSNSSWRQVRVLRSKKSPTERCSERSLYNLYTQAFKKAGFESKLKVHLPRHTLGYQQERLGVDSRDTAKLGWRRNETYSDTYAPALAKPAILAAHGYKTHEIYDPVWRRVQVPEQFLKLVCPMAEQRYSDLKGRQNLRGAANHWWLVMDLRSYLFQCGAAIFQRCPNSALFKLPALAHRDVQNWMKTTFPAELLLLQADAGDPVDLARIQDQLMRTALEEMRTQLHKTNIDNQQILRLVQRRTAVLSPTKGFTWDQYNQMASQISAGADVAITAHAAAHPPNSASNVVANNVVREPSSTPDNITGVQDPSLAPPMAVAHINLHLPPITCFSAPGAPALVFPPFIGEKSISWEVVFRHIKQPSMLWECWGPSKTLDKYSLDELWTCYNGGEPVFNENAIQTAVKPPLRMVEQHFKSKWRMGNTERKQWERFRELPEWIESEAKNQNCSPRSIIEGLERRRENGKHEQGLSALTKEIKALRFEKVKQQNIGAGTTTATATTATATTAMMTATATADMLAPPLAGHVSQTCSSMSDKKRRSQPIDPRRPKKAKT